MNTLEKITFCCLAVICGYIAVLFLIQYFIRDSFVYLVMMLATGILTAAIAKMILDDREDK